MKTIFAQGMPGLFDFKKRLFLNKNHCFFTFCDYFGNIDSIINLVLY